MYVCMLLCICMLTKRTNILFDEKTWNKLLKLSKEQEKSVGELVRTAIDSYYDLNNDTLKRIQAVCSAIEDKRTHYNGTLDYKELIEYGRNE